MRIAYRRISGAIGLTDSEIGSRGLWWEKRKALLKTLEARGHTVEIVSRMTKLSAGLTHDWQGAYDLLLVEFGSNNKQFYGEDIDESIAMMLRHKGEIIFLCDDPDLPFPWKMLPAGFDRSRIRLWYNAVSLSRFPGDPKEAAIFDMPFAALSQQVMEPRVAYEADRIVYIGRPGGRKAAVLELIADRVPFRVYSKQSEWVEFGVKVYQPPEQPQRAEFYASKLASLVLSDAKHKKLGWRTGRAYHALNAGCPVIGEAAHPIFGKLSAYHNTNELKEFIEAMKNPSVRSETTVRQQRAVRADKLIAEDTFVRCGL